MNEAFLKIGNVGTRYDIEAGGRTFHVAPDMFAVLDVDQVMFAAQLPAGVPMAPAQRAILSRALLQHFLADDDRKAFAALSPEAQMLLVLGLLRAYNEIREGSEAMARKLGLSPAEAAPGPDPTPPSSPLPAPAASPLGSA